MAGNVPKIRFPGFTEPWEQRKLGEIGFIQTGNTPSTANEKHYSTSGIPWITPSDIYNQVVSVPSRYLSEEGRTAARTAPSDSILVTCIASIGKNALINEESGFNQQINSLTPLEEFDPYFLFIDSYHWSETMRKIAASQTMPIINKTEFSKLTTKITNLKEQQKIGKFFRKIDSAIALHQRKLDDLKKFKSGLLQKMFPKAGETVPEVRFPEFTGDWEQRKLGDIAQRILRKNKSGECTLPLTISAQYGLVEQEAFFNKRIASKDLSNYIVVKAGEFAYNKSYSEGYPWGAIKRLDRYPSGVVSSLYIVFSIRKERINSDFLQILFESDVWHKEVNKVAAEGARNHGLLNITSDDFFRIQLYLPVSQEEQFQIGSFFSELNNLITLHQRKLDDLKKLKQGLLQQMFV
ncbi:restriction endonuclease subunit S [Faecalibaculum rodentium]|uniref:restriction endonuclease subunit S n=3 Tax=Faecalibaculum rodentium TaxID=1702221 RepID=UPI0025B0F564|nr:restriction endonuclease subunit S [Faecalibaculum rodentium]